MSSVNILPLGRSKAEHVNLIIEFSSLLEFLREWAETLRPHLRMLINAATLGNALATTDLPHESMCGWYGQEDWVQRPSNLRDLMKQMGDCGRELSAAETYIAAAEAYIAEWAGTSKLRREGQEN